MASRLEEVLQAAAGGKTRDVNAALGGDGGKALVTAATASGTTLLHVAAAAGSLATLTVVLRAIKAAADKVALTEGERAAASFLRMRFGASVVDTGLTPMHEAVLRGHTLLIHSLVEADGAMFDVPDARGWTPLHYAAHLDLPEAAQALLDAGAKATSADPAGLTPLHLAAMADAFIVAKLLVQHGADVEALASPQEQNSPLLMATAHGAASAAAYLLSIGAHHTTPNAKGLTPATVAKTKLVKKLLRADHAAKIVSERAAVATGLAALCVGQLALPAFRELVAAYNKFIESLEATLGVAQRVSASSSASSSASLSASSLSSSSSSSGGSSGLARQSSGAQAEAGLGAALALDFNHPVFLPTDTSLSGAPASYEPTSVPLPPLYAAVACAQTSAVRFLLDNAASPALKAPWGEPVLAAAARTGVKYILSALTNADAPDLHEQLDADGRSPLWAALELEEMAAISAVELLTEAGVDVDVRATKSRESVLFAAVRKGFLEVTIHLLTVGADPNASSVTGLTALHLAAKHNWFSVARVLIDAGANVNALDTDHNSPLHLAALHGALETAHILVEAGARTSEQTRALFTPLHAAAAVGDVEMAQMLLDAGADLGRMNSSGETAVDVATQRGHSLFVLTFRGQQVAQSASPTASPASLPPRPPSSPGLPRSESATASRPALGAVEHVDLDALARTPRGSRLAMAVFTQDEAIRWVRAAIADWAPAYSVAVMQSPERVAEVARASASHPSSPALYVTAMFSKPTPQRPVPLAAVSVHFVLHNPERSTQSELVRTIDGTPRFQQAWLDMLMEAKARVHALYTHI
ncbi:ankyrin [Thecamonas trahens ATCC 50062]|uniref:Ankyrin n=1 Tax=Thecamonas trahens ATCC 50062 TaxID=461836 RepID=A0A0L0D4T8_THETB|nr:ankyrin [Thecamonas trahens ATCC 50062]KNC47076.1 ankyrin [Thecamonas trahens ATCC 50062]|eukprot:XP_013759856.1 ankyrin [Thecamonas trahens ATCC 50062]